MGSCQQDLPQTGRRLLIPSLLMNVNLAPASFVGFRRRLAAQD
ncbi:MAG: hypothetical protein ACRD2B_06865 [Terriglobia bacterium]